MESADEAGQEDHTEDKDQLSDHEGIETDLDEDEFKDEDDVEGEDEVDEGEEVEGKKLKTKWSPECRIQLKPFQTWFFDQLLFF